MILDYTILDALGNLKQKANNYACTHARTLQRRIQVTITKQYIRWQNDTRCKVMKSASRKAVKH